jgi:flagellar biosynthesis repressor protein FlbT
MPLKLSLKPGERFVLNGAVVENGDRRATLVLQNKASVLREKDIMQEHEVDSPAKRIYFPVMMMYLSSRAENDVYDEFVRRMTEFMGAISNPDVLSECVSISRDVMSAEYYKALLRCRKLIAYEAERMGLASSSSKG